MKPVIKNKKGVEGLPLKYIIIALVGALVVGIALQFVGTLRGGIQGTAEQLNTTLAEKTTCELDSEEPAITVNSIVCSSSAETVDVDVDVIDDCGVDRASFIDSDEDTWTDLTMSSGDDKSGTWTGIYAASPGYTNGQNITVTVNVYDKATSENQGTLSQEVTCAD